MSWTLYGDGHGYRIMDGERIVCYVDDEDDAERIINAVAETVDRAAVAYGESVYAAPRPGRHDAAIKLCYDVHGQSGSQGFVTSLGRFVGRVEAACIAFNSGQIKEKVDILYTEDLW